MAGVVLIEELKTDDLKAAVSEQQRIWTARRQVLERRKKNVDEQLEIAREKTEALRKLGGNVYSEHEARQRMSALRHRLDVELAGFWQFNAAKTEEMNRGYWYDRTRTVEPSAYMIERLIRDLYPEGVAAVLKEQHAEKIIDLVASGYEDVVMMYRLVVHHDSDVRDFVSDYASELGLERVASS